MLLCLAPRSHVQVPVQIIKSDTAPHRHHRAGAPATGRIIDIAVEARGTEVAAAIGAVLEADGEAAPGGAGADAVAGAGAGAHLACGPVMGPGGGTGGPQTSLSLGSQSNLVASKSSHGRAAQAGLRGDSAGACPADAAAPLSGSGGVPRGAPHGRDGGSSRGHASLAETRTGSNQNNGKNGSDSGSNSPDENGNGTGGDAPSMTQRAAPAAHGGAGGHGKSHRHDAAGGGSGPAGSR